MNKTQEYVEVNRAKRRHLLLPADLKAKLPELYSTDGNPSSRAIVKFFSPYNGWTWYAFEYDAEENMFFGFVKGFENEWGYFSLEELDKTMVKGIVPAVERDCHIVTLPTREELNARA
jgi:hypothetical protein